MSNSKVKNVTILGLVTNIGLTFLKLFAGIVGKSTAMLADSINSGLDIITSIIVFIGIKVAGKPADDNHPYGHHKAELISTIIISIFLSITGYQIISSSIKVILSNEYETVNYLAVIAAIVSLVIKGAIYKVTYSVGISENSPSTVANALDYKSDTYISIATLIGVISSKFGFKIVDPVVAVLVGILILKMSYTVVSEAVSQIMDEATSFDEVEEIKVVAGNVEGVIGTHFIRLRKSGAVLLLDMDVVVSDKLTFLESHEISHNVIVAIKKSNPRIVDVRIHMDPYEDGDCK